MRTALTERDAQAQASDARQNAAHARALETLRVALGSKQSEVDTALFLRPTTVCVEFGTLNLVT